MPDHARCIYRWRSGDVSAKHLAQRNAKNKLSSVMTKYKMMVIKYLEAYAQVESSGSVETNV